MYSLLETAKSYLVVTKLKQSMANPEVRATIDDFFASLGPNSVVITSEVDPLDDIVPTVDPNPEDDIVPTVDPNPPISFDAAIQELTSIAESECKEETRAAAENLIEKLQRILEAIAALG